MDVVNTGCCGELLTPSCPTDCVGCTQHGTRPCCVLIEVTARCNLGCPVCYADAQGMSENRSQSPSSLPRDPSLETIAFWLDKLYDRAGACHIQLSGGEPTVRDDLEAIIRLVRAKGFSYIQLNTNGIRLAKDPHLAVKLKDAGLTCVFLQFDGMRDEVYRVLRGADLLAIKQAAVEACEQAMLPVILVPTLLRGVNEKELVPIITYGISKSPTVRGIHIQPMARFGRAQVAAERITLTQVCALLEEQSNMMIQASHFSRGNAEHPECSFNAHYFITDEGRLEPSGVVRPACCSQAEGMETCCDGVETRSAEGAETCCGGDETQNAEYTDTCCGSDETRNAECTEPRLAYTEPRLAYAEPHVAYTEPRFDSVRHAQEVQARRWGTNLSEMVDERPPAGTMDELLWQMKARSFALTGMAFMDAENLDRNRLQRCYLFIIDPQGELIPFCAYNIAHRQRAQHQ